MGLFLAAFGAATLLPLQSEAVLVGLLLSDRYWLWSLLAVATLGNVLGSLLNWWLGRAIERFRERRWFPVSPRHLERARHHYQRYGHWSLLLSWLPVIGDPLTVAAGVLALSGSGTIAGSVPLVLRAELYAVAALAGALIVALGHWLQLPPLPCALVGALVCFGLRMAAITFGWHLPVALQSGGDGEPPGPLQ